MQHVDLSPLPSGKLAMDSTAARIPMSSWSLLRLLLLLLASSSADRSFSLPDDCPTGCGNINVTYPFGLKDGCSFRPGFNLFCNTSAHPPKLFLGNDTTTQVLNVTINSFAPFVAINPLSRVFNISRDDQSTTWEETISWTMPGGDGMPYAISSDNSVTVVGCGVRAFLIDGGTNESLDNCTSTCTDVDSIGACHYDLGEGCCKMSFPYERYLLKSFKIRLTLLNETQPSSTANFSSVVKILVASDYIPTDDPPRSYVGYHFKRRDLYDTKNISIDNGQFLLDWAILDERTCTRDNSNNVCDLSDNSHCRNSSTPGFGYNCFCGYWDEDLGNPYIPHGCKAQKCSFGICSKLLLGLTIGVSIGVALLLFAILTKFIIRRWKKIKQKKIKEKHFHQNHGLLLQQLISSNEDIAERTKIFSLEEMEKATNNFDISRILGKGGHGTVYKGILADQRVVAIKKSKIEVKGEIDQFINEVAILSRINHRNIVRLFGCCLEIEVPLLVYEFISNGTLYDHLYLRDASTILSWEHRLRIASQAAAALSYLHSAAFISIFHRDVKSSNILLDDNLTAKVSDFGASRSIPDDETHIVTIVQGTYGYLDPQYYRTGELTEKSDVYSFGVILLELLTGKKPISTDLVGEERNLTINFLRAANENRHFDLMDARVKVEGATKELEDVAKLACMCISFERNSRPTMKEVEYTLQILLRERKKTQEYKEDIDESRILVSSNASHGVSMVNNPNQDNEDPTQNYSMVKHLLSTIDFPR